jgi:hypothetical protein
MKGMVPHSFKKLNDDSPFWACNYCMQYYYILQHCTHRRHGKSYFMNVGKTKELLITAYLLKSFVRLLKYKKLTKLKRDRSQLQMFRCYVVVIKRGATTFKRFDLKIERTANIESY